MQLLLLVAIPAFAHANSAPVVTNVVATQIPSTGQVRVTFDVSDADGDPVTARLICSSDNGVNFDLLPVTVSGDANRSMAAGPGKQIIWDAGRDYPGRYWQQVVAKVVCSDGPATSGEMVLVPAGTFTMGSDASPFGSGPPHSVTLSSFYIDKFEVTCAEFEQFILAGGYSTPAFWSAAGWNWRLTNNVTQPGYWNDASLHVGTGYPGFPMLGVSWYEAEAYANFAGKRLATEAEWEYAARGTDGREYPWGNGLIDNAANFYGSNDPYEPSSTPVGYYDGTVQPYPSYGTSSGAGPFGTFDQAGNVAEWVNDWWGGYTAGAVTNPQGPPSGAYRVVRGGHSRSSSCGNNYHLFLRTFERYPYTYYPCSSYENYPTLQLPAIGFRCARNAN